MTRAPKISTRLTTPPKKNKDLMIKMCGHYVFEDTVFKDIKKQYKDDLNKLAINNIKKKILNIVKDL